MGRQGLKCSQRNLERLCNTLRIMMDDTTIVRYSQMITQVQQGVFEWQFGRVDASSAVRRSRCGMSTQLPVVYLGAIP